MRYAMSLLLALVLVAWTAPIQASDVIEGEILDMSCFIPRGAKGPSHARCAKSCAENGMPLGLLTEDDKIYLLYPKHGKEGAFETVKGLAGESAKLTGAAAEREGLSGFEVHEAAAVK